ncbi:MAG: 30S ribosome-binding factor RbfA [Anaerolineae bacterium]
MTSHRIERANSFIQQELTLALQNQMRDPRMDALTVTEVRLTPDRRIARIYVACYRDEDTLTDGLKALESAKGALRHRLAQNLHWRFTPELEFRADLTWQRAERIEALLEQIAEDGESDALDSDESDQQGVEGND